MPSVQRIAAARAHCDRVGAGAEGTDKGVRSVSNREVDRVRGRALDDDRLDRQAGQRGTKGIHDAAGQVKRVAARAREGPAFVKNAFAWFVPVPLVSETTAEPVNGAEAD